MSMRAAIESALASGPGPMTGAQIRAALPTPVGSIALHRYLWNLRARGIVSARRRGGVWVYAQKSHQWLERASVWDWMADA